MLKKITNPFVKKESFRFSSEEELIKLFALPGSLVFYEFRTDSIHNYEIVHIFYKNVEKKYLR